ncbi:MAG: hypothetical protein K2X91_05525 [Thermoleophilia bacterium]|nr:hypothetical protein [Thermoleophilia bacterium]
MLKRAALAAGLIAGGLLAPAAPPAHADVYTSISLAAVANARLQGRHPEYPSGQGVLLGDVPFDIPSTGPNMWSAANAAGGGGAVVSATLPIGMTGVTGVHTLINTLWGVSGGPALAALRFAFDDGTIYVKPLIGDDDIRDYYQNTFTNTINGTTTVRVFFTDTDYDGRTNRHRLDKQFIDLSAYRDRTLMSMTLVDRGSEGVQRTWLAGLTVQAVPEPSPPALLAAGAAVVLAARGLRRLLRRAA